MGVHQPVDDDLWRERLPDDRGAQLDGQRALDGSGPAQRAPQAGLARVDRDRPQAIDVGLAPVHHHLAVDPRIEVHVVDRLLEGAHRDDHVAPLEIQGVHLELVADRVVVLGAAPRGGLAVDDQLEGRGARLQADEEAIGTQGHQHVAAGQRQLHRVVSVQAGQQLSVRADQQQATGRVVGRDLELVGGQDHLNPPPRLGSTARIGCMSRRPWGHASRARLVGEPWAGQADDAESDEQANHARIEVHVRGVDLWRPNDIGSVRAGPGKVSPGATGQGAPVFHHKQSVAPKPVTIATGDRPV